MIIEFTGCSGAGKSFFFNKVRLELAKRGCTTYTPFELMLGRRILGLVRLEMLRSLILDILVLFIFIPAYFLNRPILNFAYRIIFAHKTINSSSFLSRLNLIRNVTKKIVLDHFLRGRSRGKIVLVDEGTIHISHIIFGGRVPDKRELADFLEKVPQPDLIVCLNSPIEVLIKRALSRPDPPIRKASKTTLRNFVEASSAMFAALTKEFVSSHKLIVIDGSRKDPIQVNELTSRICESHQPKKVSRIAV